MTSRAQESRFQSVLAGALAAGLASLVALAAETATALPLPQTIPNVALSSRAPVRSFLIDLGALPARPVLVIEVTPDVLHPTMQLQITASNWQSMPTANVTCPDASYPADISTSGPGVAVLERALYSCAMAAGAFAGGQVRIDVRAVDFGAFSTSATVTVSIRGETRIATGTEVVQVDTALNVVHPVSIYPSRETVLYSASDKSSNGAGSFLWAGSSITSGLVEYPLHSLLAFQFPTSMPNVATIVDASLRLQVTSTLGGGGDLSLWQIRPSLNAWASGNANAAGDEFAGATSTTAAATWIHRSSPIETWTTPGGDVVTPALATQSATAPGAITISSPELLRTVQGMFVRPGDYDGFLISGPRNHSVTRAVQLASANHSSAGLWPRLQIDYVLSAPYVSGDGLTGALQFLDEGQNFRWIYDLDHDDIFVTTIGGVCQVVNASPDHFPYTYHYGGTPGFTGVDCCTWQIDSPGSGTIGTGQALFFHNLDASNPANMPPDTDQDGIRNLCDNCPTTPNGPLRGTCLVGLIGSICNSNQQCGNGGLCSLSQEDGNGDFTGNACVPEPGLSVGLFTGLTLLAGLSSRGHIVRRSSSRSDERSAERGSCDG